MSKFEKILVILAGICGIFLILININGNFIVNKVSIIFGLFLIIFAIMKAKILR